MNNILTIATHENPILRQEAQPITNIKDTSVKTLINSLLNTLKFYNGVGIAAPQVSQSLRLFIVASYPNQRYPFAPKMNPTVMINPKIIGYNPQKVKDWEGCLSVPNIRGLVPRYGEIEVEYFDMEGNLKFCILKNFIGRIFQHELDHLDGILFIDRLENPQDKFTEAQYQKIITQQI
jgi:peptide deformylase